MNISNIRNGKIIIACKTVQTPHCSTFLLIIFYQQSTNSHGAQHRASTEWRLFHLRGDPPRASAPHYCEPGGRAQRHPRHAAPHRSPRPRPSSLPHDGAASQVRDHGVSRAGYNVSGSCEVLLRPYRGYSSEIKIILSSTLSSVIEIWLPM